MMRYFFASALWFIYSLSFAQESLSLEQAISLGMKSNFDIQISQMEHSMSQKNNTWGQAGRYPTVNLNGNQNNSVVQRVPANPFAVAGRNISNNITGQLDVMFTLFDGFSIKMSKDRLEQLEKLSKGRSVFAMEAVVQSIVLGYYRALLEKEKLKVMWVNLGFSKERYEYVKLKKLLGSAIPFDVLQEENNYLTDSANVLLQEIEYKNAHRELNLLLNESMTKEFSLTDSLVFSDEAYVYEDLAERMGKSNSNLQNQFINQELLRTTVKLQQSNLYPSLFLNTGVNGSLDWLNANFRTLTGKQIESTVGFVNRDPAQPVYNNVNEILQSVKTLQGNSYGAYANVGLRWTLFNGGQIRRSIENAQIDEKIGQLNTDQLKRSLESDLMVNYDQYNLRRKLVTIAKIKLKAAQLNLSLANERYKNGSISAIDLRIIQENFLNSALNNYSAIFSAIAMKMELTRLTGGFVATLPVN